MQDLSIEYDRLNSEMNDLKKQVRQLFEEIRILKENFQALGYSSEDMILTKEESSQVNKTRELVKKGDLSEFFELV
ncbi:MAG: hypothetical protein ACC656_11590 [Candidatus Heimdallarchaeota archaeon]